MKTSIVLLTLAAAAHAGFMPPMVNKGFKPMAEKWHASIEEDEYSEPYDYPPPEFEDHPKTIHVHEDHGHYDHHHFDDIDEYHPPKIEHPKTVHIHEEPEVRVVKEPQTVHVHEHHHHHHHHVKTLPVSIIKKTVYIKHG